MQEQHHKTAAKTVTLVLGGVRSGKSRLALTLASKFARVAFVATAKVTDDEMRVKIERHRAERPAHWRTIEEPLALDAAIVAGASDADVVVVDCLTIHAAHLMELEESENAAVMGRLIQALRQPPVHVILVSNEVGSGVVPAYPVGRRYRDLLGEMNQAVAAVADNVVLTVAGLPLVLKGQLEAQQ
jgi:adenosylcobinamide kinase / adenosylcobinamide-phosphate guanylyltransferase